MATFTTPTTTESSSHRFWGRFRMVVGVSVVWDGAHFTDRPVPWLGEIAELVEGETWFQGGRTYEVSDDTASLLAADGYDVGGEGGFGDSGFGEGAYGQ